MTDTLQPDVYLSKLKAGMQVKLGHLLFCSFLAAIFLGAVPIPAAYAQLYTFETGGNNTLSNAQMIENPEKIQYIYGVTFLGLDTADYYRLTFSKYTQNVQFTLLVPQDKTTTNFYPELIITDPNTTHIFGSVPYGFPPQLGGRVFNWAAESDQTFTDNNVFENFKVGPSVTKDVSANTYFVVVHDPEAKGGRYVLKIGAETPIKDWRDYLNFVTAFVRIKLKLY